jgi:hypothetical protein
MNVSDSTLRILHGVACFLHLTQFGYAEALVNTKFKGESLFALTNPVASEPGSLQPLKINSLGFYQISQLVPWFSLLSSANHAWSLIDFAGYQKYVTQGYNPVRWAEYSISAGLMYYVVASLSGYIDVKGLSALVMSNVALQYLGYSLEKDVGRSLQAGPNTTLGQSLYESATRQEYAGFFVFVAQLVPIWTSFFTVVSEANQLNEQVPDFVWAIIFIITFFFLSFGILSVYYLRTARPSPFHRAGFTVIKSKRLTFKAVEVGYLILSFCAKTFLMNMVLFGTVQSRSDDNLISPSKSDSEVESDLG